MTAAPRRVLVILIVTAALSMTLRLELLSKGPYHSDCLWLAIQSQNIVKTGHMQYLQSSGLPLTALAGAAFVGLTGAAGDLDRAVFAVNLMAAVFGALSVIPFFFFMRRFSDEVTAAVSVLLVTVNPFLVGLSTFGNSHAPAFFFLTIALWAAAGYRRDGRRRDLVWTGIGLGLMGAARVQDLVVMAPTLLLMTCRPPRGKSVRGPLDWLIPWAIAALIVVSAYIPKFAVGRAGGEGVGAFVYGNLLAYWDPLPLSGYGVMLRRLMETFSWPEWAAMLAGVMILFRQGRYRELSVLAVWAVTPMLVFGQLAFFVFRFLIVTVAALLILEAVAVGALWRRNRWWGAAGAALLMITVITHALPYYKIYHHRHRQALLVDFFRWVGIVTEPQAYVYERDHIAWINAYAQRRFVGVDRSNAEGVARFRQRIDSLLAGGHPVYITKYGLMDRDDILRRELIKHYRLEWVGSRMIEDWHLGFMKQVVVPNDLLRVRAREN